MNSFYDENPSAYKRLKRQVSQFAKEFRRHSCCLPSAHYDYVPPTSDEIKAVLKFAGWSYADAAKLLGVSYNSKGGSTTVQKWCTDESSSEHRKIPSAAWRLLLIYAAIVNVKAEEEFDILSGKF